MGSVTHGSVMKKFGRRMAATRETSPGGPSFMARLSGTFNNVGYQHSVDVKRPRPRMEVCPWRLVRAQNRTERRIYFHGLPDSSTEDSQADKRCVFAGNESAKKGQPCTYRRAPR